MDDAEERRLARKARRQEKRREEILEAARAVLLADGLAGFTVAAIAAEADVSKPAVYYYFPSRDALLEGVLVDRFEAETVALETAIAAAPDGVGAVEAMVRAYIGHYAGDRDSFRVLQVWIQSGPARADFLERNLYPMSRRVMGPLEEKLLADQAAGAVTDALSARRFSNVALMTAWGIVSLISGMEAVGGSLLFDVDGMTDEACVMLRRAAAP